MYKCHGYVGGSHAWRIESGENTSDYILAVDRGIPCEGHTQIVSYHGDNIPSIESIKKFLQINEAKLKEMIDSFIENVNAAAKEFGYSQVESIAVIFKYNLLKYIVNGALLIE